MNRLAELLRNRMDIDKLSVRAVAKQTGVSHSTIARAVNGETVEVDTLVRIANFLGVKAESLLDVRSEPDEILQQISMVLSIEPELSRVFGEIARKVSNKEMDKKVLAEIAAFAAYRLQMHSQTSDVEVEEKVSSH